MICLSPPSLPVATTLALLLAGCAAPPTDDTDPVDTVAAQVDPDGDTIVTSHEGDADPDGDLIPAWQDPDSDDDGLPDRFEAGDADPTTLPFDRDGDRTPDFLDLDSDNNGIEDAREGRADADGDGDADAFDLDDDGDGLPDVEELWEGIAIDTDDDGLDDHRDPDSDDDGIPDAVEGRCPFVQGLCDTDGDEEPDLHDLDSDGDGFSDADEAGEDPSHPRDTDGDGTPDFRDLDSDGDSLPDAYERDRLGTDPYARDTDGDGLADASELELETDPLDASSTWDGWMIELGERTEREEELTFDLGVERLDVVVAYTPTATKRYGEFAKGLFSKLAETARSRIEDPAFALVEYGGYSPRVYTGWKKSQWLADPDHEGCKSLFVDVPLSTPKDAVDVAATFDVVPWKRACWFSPAPYESFVQMFEGPGRDDDCNGIYDPKWDTRPWQAAPDDPFGGAGGQRLDDQANLGVRSGLGFRPFSRPVVLWFVGSQYTDPGAVHPLPEHYINVGIGYGWAWDIEPWPVFRSTPKDCPSDADYLAAARAVNDQGAVLVGIRSEYPDLSPESDPTWSMRRFLSELDAKVDVDGDGTLDLPFVDGADIETLIEAGDEPAIRKALEGILTRIENEIAFDSVRLEPTGDTHGLLAQVHPERRTGLRKGDRVSFSVTFRGTVPAKDHDQLFRMGLNVLTDDDDLVAYQDILVVVPGRRE